ncbi:unknown [Firmicutes bacterium CAG:102]|nr:unknown [Firmicutes bacterium CAG:102]
MLTLLVIRLFNFILNFIQKKLTEKLFKNRHELMKLQLEKAYLQQRIAELKQITENK